MRRRPARGTVVFLGPTLAVAEAERLLPATYLPPARMGSVYRAARAGARVIGIVDGYFEQVPAVWHKEILWALSTGVRVYGAASMGALRAAELDRYGMIGVGEIYRHYRAGELIDDDEVALLHGPAQSGYRPASVPLVNIRATLRRAVRAGVLVESAADALIDVARGMHYPERTYESVLAAAGRHEPALGGDGLRCWIDGHAVDQKRLDALELLATLRAAGRRSRKAAPAGRPVFERTWIWDQLTAESETAADTEGGPAQE